MITGSKIRLRAKRLADALNDYSWRTDLELVQLDAVPPLNIAFSDYLQSYAIELKRPSTTRHAFAIETPEGKHIGNIVYYDIDRAKGESEFGIMIGNRDFWGKGYGTSATTALADYIFKHTNLKRIYLKTLRSNVRAQKCFKKCGFLPYGRSKRNGFNFVLMELERTKWQENQCQASGQIKHV